MSVSFFAETTSKILVLAGDGKIFTLDAGKLPGGRSQGEPLRLLADIGEGETISAVFPYAPGAKMLVASSDGRGFVAPQDEMIGGTRKGKALLGVEKPATAAIMTPAEGDHVAVDWREPPAARLSAGAGPRNGARQRRPLAEIPRRRGQ